MGFKPKASDIVAQLGDGGEAPEQDDEAGGGDLEAAMSDLMDAFKSGDAAAAAKAFTHALALADSQG